MSTPISTSSPTSYPQGPLPSEDRTCRAASTSPYPPAQFSADNTAQAHQTRNGTNSPSRTTTLPRPDTKASPTAPPAKPKYLLSFTSSPKRVAPTPAPSSPPPLGATHPLRDLSYPAHPGRPPCLRRGRLEFVGRLTNQHRRRNGPSRSLICVAPC